MNQLNIKWSTKVPRTMMINHYSKLFTYKNLNLSITRGKKDIVEDEIKDQ